MEGCHTFGFTHLLENGPIHFLVNETMVQRIIDCVNMSLKENPDAWEFVRQGGLIQHLSQPSDHPVVKLIVEAMKKDDHTGGTAESCLRLVTYLARQRGIELGLGRS